MFPAFFLVIAKFNIIIKCKFIITSLHFFTSKCMFFAGERTFGVLTKLDLMDKGTNALDVSFLICVKTTFLSFRMGNLDF